MSEPSILLEAKELSAGYRQGWNLQNLCFEVHDGEMVAILGPNGSGKSTLLRAITHMLPELRGRRMMSTAKPDSFATDHSALPT